MLTKYINRNDIPNDNGPLWQLDSERYETTCKNFIVFLVKGDLDSCTKVIEVFNLLELTIPESSVREVINQLPLTKSEKEELIEEISQMEIIQ